MKDTRTDQERRDEFIRMYRKSGGGLEDGLKLWRKHELEKSATDGSGVSLIAAERRRQQDEEGYTPEHDDIETQGELVLAAQTYTDYALGQILNEPLFPDQLDWPWDTGNWKPSDDPIRNLVKAGALIAAEIDRLQRAADKSSS